MIQHSTWVHLRIPFSFFLMPVFFFAAAAMPEVVFGWEYLGVFFILHLFVYPASNAYNSYYDKDEGSIGGVENPPPVSDELWWVSLCFDALGLLWAFFISPLFCFLVLVYGLASKAYSHPAVRIKKYAWGGAAFVVFFQGFFTFLMVWVGLKGESPLSELPMVVLYGAILSSLMLLGSYPMTQVYQHEEDAQRGDYTLSLWLGIRGTFLYTGVVFGAVTGLFVLYFYTYFSLYWAVSFVLALSPVLLFFFYWFYRVWYNAKEANFRNTMRLNLFSAICLNLFFNALCWFQ
ncbi:MAG: ubiquinone biosynthesis protein UbiA [Cytophagales bacterium]|nr:MAG: ubiquinone biosynthesis protein UbiA [Cytophagales bacterium]